MDYTDSTTGWSKCSNADIQKFLNGLKKNCLIRKYSIDIIYLAYLKFMKAIILIVCLPSSRFITRYNLIKYQSLIAIGTPGRSTDWSEGTSETGTAVPPSGECKPPICVADPAI